jgi:hypothetical protein
MIYFILNSKARITNPSSTQRPRQKTKTPQQAAEEHDIVNIPLEDTPWLKKMIKSMVKEAITRFRFKSTNYI